MPPKRTKKAARTASNDGAAPAASTTRKRARSTTIIPAAAVSHPEATEVDDSVASVQPAAPAEVNVDDDASRTISEVSAVPQPGRSAGRRQRQTTLTGETASSNAATGGEVKPSAPAARTDGGGSGSKTKNGAGGGKSAAAAAAALAGPSAVPLLEAALLAHLRSAVVLRAVRRSRRSIVLTAVPSSTQQTDALDALAAETAAQSPVQPILSTAEEEGTDEVKPTDTSSDEEEEREGKEKEEEEEAAAEDDVDAAAAQSHAGEDGETQAFLALPCVQHFILHECARVARVVRVDGGNGLGDDPATRALELFGLLLSMLDEPGPFATLLTLACPACRSVGINTDSLSKLGDFLVLSQRVRWDELANLTQTQICELLGLADGCRDAAGAPVAPLHCCPYAQAHLDLQLLMATLSPIRGTLSKCTLNCTFVPFQVGDLPAIATAAKRYYRALDAYNTLLERRWHQQRAGVHITTAAQRQRKTSPVVPNSVLTLFRHCADDETWAEAAFRDVFPGTNVLTGTPHFSYSDLQLRIRAAYAYTRADVLGRGGYVNLSLRTPTSYFRGQTTSNYYIEAEMIFLSQLFTFAKVFQHVAEGVCYGTGGDGVRAHAQRCLCHPRTTPSDASFLLMEEHTPYVAALRRCREEQYLLVDENEEKAEAALSCSQAATVDVDADRSNSNDDAPAGGAARTIGDVSYYAAGSFARFYATLDLTAEMNGTQVVDFVTRAAADNAEALPASAVPAAYIHASLKRHQLEDVQWMWNKEDGYREHVQVPLYRCTFLGAARQPVAQRSGVLLYCATTREMIVARGAAAQTPKWGITGCRIRGGLLCDDVGLGKTLSVLTLCAYDRAMRESGAVADSDDDDDGGGGDDAGSDASGAAGQSSATRFWQISARATVVRSAAFDFNTQILRWGFGAGTFHAGIAPHTRSPTRLPRTTLVVVPLSIAGQWIEELHKFYPSASYILFYGAKRMQYTVDDLQRADFVLTTYETLSTHLRQENDGLRYWLARSADLADDAACGSAALHGWSACRPSHVRTALRSFASSTVWPELPDEADPRLRRFHRSRGYAVEIQAAQGEAAAQIARGRGRGRGGRRGRGRGQAASALDAAKRDVPPQPGAWTFDHENPRGGPGFHCPAFSVYVYASDELAAHDAVAAPPSPAAYRRLCAGSGSAVSDTFLDAVWELLKGYAAAAAVAVEGASYELPVGLFDEVSVGHNTESFLTLLFDAEVRYPMDARTRRLFVRHVLLPPLWQPLQQYWTEMQSHDAAVASAELTGRMPPRILDLLFHRVVLDESQKCGTNSLFHLLLGERRWAVTGTPLNNSKTESLGASLAFLGMHSAAQVLSRPPLRMFTLFTNWIPRHSAAHQTLLWSFFARLAYRVVVRFEARLGIPPDPDQRYREVTFCLCAECTQDCAYGGAGGPDAVTAVEFRRREDVGRFPCALPCLPNTLMEILALTMVRHERDQQVSRELQLPPVHYRLHRADLAAEEMRLYDPVARAVMDAAALLHRQGVLTSYMGRAMQWVQELCRLCLHPSRVGDAAWLRDAVAGRLFRPGRPLQGVEDAAELAAAVAATFVPVTAQEALEWAQSLRTSHEQALLGDAWQPVSAARSNARVVPEETVSALKDLMANPPLPPLCGVCMDDMVAPTLLNCFHMFCKECLIGVIDASRSFTGNVNAKCPYCRDPKSMLDEKRVIVVENAAVADEEPAVPPAAEANDAASSALTEDDVEAALSGIGDGSRVRAFVELVKEIWQRDPGDGVLVFSKYPASLQMAHDAVQAAGYAPHIVRGASTLAQRQRVMRALQQPGGAAPVPHRILFVTSRSANAGLTLTFANHVVFLEPNLNPAMEQQAVGRVHRFGQLKQVTVHHLYAPRTIEEVIYRRSVRLREQATQQPAAVAEFVPGQMVDPNAMQRRTQFGRIAPAEISLLLEYPVPAQHE